MALAGAFLEELNSSPAWQQAAIPFPFLPYNLPLTRQPAIAEICLEKFKVTAVEHSLVFKCQ